MAGCGSSLYDTLEGTWSGEIKGQSFTVEFRPSDEAVFFDGLGGAMRLKEERDSNVLLEMTGPDGRTGEVVITPLDETRSRLEIPRLSFSVELRRAA
ncbi:MAG: hypothetical protein KA184_09025 [Candidatus Hydrogenedentes bacterium]|nr:hypothetical protein [Candidatus Hydrogenedentota bacterium]